MRVTKKTGSSRRRFLSGALAAGTGSILAFAQRAAQAPQQGATPGAGSPPPKTARITSSLMIWTIKGTFEEKVALAARAGFQSLELVSEHLKWSEAEVTKYKRTVQSYGLGLDALLAQHDWTTRPVTMVNPAHRDAFLQEVRDSITWAKKLNVPQIILMSGNIQPGMSHEAQYASMLEGGKRAADLASAADIKLILENLNSKVNHPNYFLTSAREALQCVKEVDNPHFRLLFDIYHESVQNGDPIPIITDAAPYTAVFHVADAPGRHDPGTGQMKWDEIYIAIAKANYSGYIAMEYLPVADELESLMKALTQMRKDINSVPLPNQQPATTAYLT